MSALRPQLRDLVRELAGRDEKVSRLLEMRATAQRPHDPALGKRLASSVSEALKSRGFVDYRGSFGVASDARDVLDELETYLDAGAADTVRPALLRALTRLVAISQRADDSSGVIGDECQRAADLYARSCREGKPERRKLARWLVKFRDESPGWPDLTLADFVDCFDDGALATYRQAVTEVDVLRSGERHRFEVDKMLLELADHDGDVDRAIELLSQGRRGVSYGAIIERLHAAGRESEVLLWTDRAIADGRIAADDGNEYWLGARTVADRYAAAGRADEGLDVLRRAYRSRAGHSTFARLTSYADSIGRPGEWDWAIAEARRLAATPGGSGAALIDIALGEDDFDLAWDAANAYGAGQQWQRLAETSRSTRPLDAARLFHPIVDDMLQRADTRMYPKVAKQLVELRGYYDDADSADEFRAYVDDIRAAYARRPSLLKALDRKKL